MARRLRSAGEAVDALALFDPPPVPPRFRHRVPDRLRARIAVWLGRGRSVPHGESLRRALARYRPGGYSGLAHLFLTLECPPDGPDASEAAWRRLFDGTAAPRIAERLGATVYSAGRAL
jgi:hypothetical protein